MSHVLEVRVWCWRLVRRVSRILTWMFGQVVIERTGYSAKDVIREGQVCQKIFGLNDWLHFMRRSKLKRMSLEILITPPRRSVDSSPDLLPTLRACFRTKQEDLVNISLYLVDTFLLQSRGNIYQELVLIYLNESTSSLACKSPKNYLIDIPRRKYGPSIILWDRVGSDRTDASSRPARMEMDSTARMVRTWGMHNETTTIDWEQLISSPRWCMFDMIIPKEHSEYKSSSYKWKECEQVTYLLLYKIWTCLSYLRRTSQHFVTQVVVDDRGQVLCIYSGY